MMTDDNHQMIKKLHLLDPSSTVLYMLLRSGRRVFITYEGYGSNPRDPSADADPGDREYFLKLYEEYTPENMQDSETTELNERTKRYESPEAFIAAVESGELRFVALDAPIPWAVAQS